MNFNVFAPKYQISAQFGYKFSRQTVLEQALPAFATASLRHCQVLKKNFQKQNFKILGQHYCHHSKYLCAISHSDRTQLTVTGTSEALVVWAVRGHHAV